MFIFNVLILCCVFILHRMSNEAEALIMYDPRSRYYSYYMNGGRYGSYGSFYDQEKIKIYSSRSSAPPKQTTQTTQKQTHSSSRTRSRSKPSVIDLSFKPLGALKIDSLTHGELEFNPEALNDVLLAIASGALSMVPDFYSYIPSLPSLYGGAPSEAESPDDFSPPRKHHRNDDQDDAGEEDDDDGRDPEDDPEKNPKEDEDDDNDDDPEKNNTNRDDDDDLGDNATEDPDDNDHKPDPDEPAEPEPENKEPDKNPDEEVPEIGPEIPIEEIPAPEGYVDKFVRYYSYAKPIAKAASLFVPGLGQYRGVMFGMEMADLAYQTASMYRNGDGMLSIGWHLGKEVFTRLGRRSADLPPVPKIPDTTTSWMEFEKFMNEVRSTNYPLLDDEKELEIKTSVAKIVRKYFHDQQEYKDKARRTQFIDLMISCVKFIATQNTAPES